MQVHRIGECRNCGACCMVVYPDGVRRLCQHYTNKSKLHCTIYSKRPKECRDFPRNPMDNERLKQWCGFSFVDDKGRVVDANMDTRVRLTPI